MPSSVRLLRTNRGGCTRRCVTFAGMTTGLSPLLVVRATRVRGASLAVEGAALSMLVPPYILRARPPNPYAKPASSRLAMKAGSWLLARQRRLTGSRTKPVWALLRNQSGMRQISQTAGPGPASRPEWRPDAFHPGFVTLEATRGGPGSPRPGPARLPASESFSQPAIPGIPRTLAGSQSSPAPGHRTPSRAPAQVSAQSTKPPDGRIKVPRPSFGPDWSSRPSAEGGPVHAAESCLIPAIESSFIAHAGITTCGLMNPIAVGTRS